MQTVRAASGKQERDWAADDVERRIGKGGKDLPAKDAEKIKEKLRNPRDAELSFVLFLSLQLHPSHEIGKSRFRPQVFPFRFNIQKHHSHVFCSEGFLQIVECFYAIAES